MQDNDRQLRAMLEQLEIPAPASNLAERIIAQASTLRHASPKRSSFLSELAELFMPKPALAVACSLMVGVLVGTQWPQTNQPTNETFTENFLSYEGDIL